MHCWWKEKEVEPLWKTVWHLLKLNMHLPFDQAMLLFNIHLREKCPCFTKGHRQECSQQPHLS